MFCTSVSSCWHIQWVVNYILAHVADVDLQKEENVQDISEDDVISVLPENKVNNNLVMVSYQIMIYNNILYR